MRLTELVGVFKRESADFICVLRVLVELLVRSNPPSCVGVFLELGFVAQIIDCPDLLLLETVLNVSMYLNDPFSACSLVTSPFVFMTFTSLVQLSVNIHLRQYRFRCVTRFGWIAAPLLFVALLSQLAYLLQLILHRVILTLVDWS